MGGIDGFAVESGDDLVFQHVGFFLGGSVYHAAGQRRKLAAGELAGMQGDFKAKGPGGLGYGLKGDGCVFRVQEPANGCAPGVKLPCQVRDSDIALVHLFFERHRQLLLGAPGGRGNPFK